MLHTIQNNSLKIVISEQGAEMQSIQDSYGTEYLWQGDPQYWKSRATNLFPFTGKAVNGEYYLDGNCYPIGPHGFARHSRFQCVEKDDLHLIMELASNEELFATFPRQFVFQVQYALKGNTLAITYRVENKDDKILYFGLGGHPGFQVPFAGGNFADYRLVFSGKCHPQQLLFANPTPSGHGMQDYPLIEDQYILLRHDLFADGGLFLKDTTGKVTLESPNPDHSITVSFPDMPYVGFWHTPDSDAPFICIEPWCSLPGISDRPTVFEEKPDLLHLDPDGIYANTWTISIQ